MASSSFATLPPPATGWAALPRDLLWSLFVRLGQHEVLQSAALACAAWWRFARDEPALWRRVDLIPPAVDVVGALRGGDDGSDDDCFVGDWMFDEAAAAAAAAAEAQDDYGVMGWKAMARAAVDRSAGQCEAFCGRVDDDVLIYLADRAPSLRSLQVTSSYYDVSSEVFSDLIKKFPLLEELELVLKSDATYNNTTICQEPPSRNSWAELLISTCQSCRNLNRFAVRRVGRDPHADPWNWKRREPKFSRPSWIPTMRKLRSLVLCGDSFTKCLVLRIVDSCPNLESLDISNVWCINVIWRDKEYQDKFSRIKVVHLPYHCHDSDESDYDM